MVLVVVVVVFVDAFSGAVPGADVACYHTLTLQKTQDSGGGGGGENTFKRRSHDAIFLESEPGDWVGSYDFGLERIC